MKRAIVVCERSGRVRRALRERGVDAWSNDIVPADDGSEYHIQCDARKVLNRKWDLMIGFPPCTYLCNSGVRWLHENTSRWPKLFEAADFFKFLLDAPIGEIALENPQMHKYAIRLIGQGPTQYIQPWQFGHGETKKTGLWLKNLPPLMSTRLMTGREARIHRMPPSEDRGIQRSITYDGVAEAMAEQWGHA